jgi:hypothetical protein
MVESATTLVVVTVEVPVEAVSVPVTPTIELMAAWTVASAVVVEVVSVTVAEVVTTGADVVVVVVIVSVTVVGAVAVAAVVSSTLVSLARDEGLHDDESPPTITSLYATVCTGS